VRAAVERAARLAREAGVDDRTRAQLALCAGPASPRAGRLAAGRREILKETRAQA